MKIKKTINSNGNVQYYCGETVISVAKYKSLQNNKIVGGMDGDL